ncbi:MAG: hypothetical protein HZA84_01175 [Thaumarchaeota archaeon]|nr:hypothetical protein [Nitrososphaerota archaeon]
MKLSIRTIFVFMMMATVVQSFHMVEHIAQLIQRYTLGFSAAHGILGDLLDLEPVHFTFNLVYLALTTFVWLGFRNLFMEWNMKLAYRMIIFTLGFQSWHFIEHVVKIQQHFTEGCVSCPGILGYFVNPIVLHFAYNLIVFVPFAALAYLFMTRKKSGALKEIN